MLEQTLWEAADKLRGNQKPGDYEHVVLRLVFLKHISDHFEERRSGFQGKLVAEGTKPERIGSLLEDRAEYTSHDVFWVSELARWVALRPRQSCPRSSSRSTRRWFSSKKITLRFVA